jgi:peptidyl-prolyl cis-trans isomerase D
MISLLQNILQKHHRWLLSILLAVIVVAFVFTIGASPGIGKSNAKHVYFFGYDMADSKQLNELIAGVACTEILNGRAGNYPANHLESLVLRRAVALGLAKELRVPDPSPENLKAYIRKLPIFLDGSGKFSPSLYEAALKKLDSGGVDSDRLKGILCENCSIEAVESALSGPGVAFKSRTMAQLARMYAEYDLVATTISTDGIVVDGDIVNAAIENFYGEHADRYVQPVTYSVSAVRFPVDDFRKKVKPPEEGDLRTFFLENRGAFPVDAKFEDILDDVRVKYTDVEAAKLTCAAAEGFVGELCDQNIPRNSAELESLLERSGASVEKIPPFHAGNLPRIDGIGAQYLLGACDLDESKYYGDPFQTENGAAVLLLRGVDGERQLPLEEVREAVKADILEAKKLAALSEKVERIRREVLVELSVAGDIIPILQKNALPYEVFSGISIGNCDEKGLDLECKFAIASLSKDDRVRLVSYDKDRVRMLVVTGRNENGGDFATAERIRDMDTAIRVLHRQNFLFDFFKSQAEKFPRVGMFR